MVFHGKVSSSDHRPPSANAEHKAVISQHVNTYRRVSGKKWSLFTSLHELLSYNQTMPELYYHDTLHSWCCVFVSGCKCVIFFFCSFLIRFIPINLPLPPPSTYPALGVCCCSLPSHRADVADPPPPATGTWLLPCVSSTIHELHSLLSQVSSGGYK